MPGARSPQLQSGRLAHRRTWPVNSGAIAAARTVRDLADASMGMKSSTTSLSSSLSGSWTAWRRTISGNSSSGTAGNWNSRRLDAAPAHGHQRQSRSGPVRASARPAAIDRPMSAAVRLPAEASAPQRNGEGPLDHRWLPCFAATTTRASAPSHSNARSSAMLRFSLPLRFKRLEGWQPPSPFGRGAGGEGVGAAPQEPGRLLRPALTLTLSRRERGPGTLPSLAGFSAQIRPVPFFRVVIGPPSRPKAPPAESRLRAG